MARGARWPALERGVAAARNTAHAISGRLSVGLNVAAGGETPTMLLAVFRRAEPQIEVSLRTFELNQPATAELCVAWRAGETSQVVRRFADVVIAAARESGDM